MRPDSRFTGAARDGSLPIASAMFRTGQNTSQPALTSASAKWEPMNEAAPSLAPVVVFPNFLGYKSISDSSGISTFVCVGNAWN
jgi:hypothetical protein